MTIFVIPAVYPNDNNPGLGIFVKELNKKFSINNKVITLNVSGIGIKSWMRRKNKEIKKYVGDEGVVYELHPIGFATTYFPSIATQLTYTAIKKLYKIAVQEYGKPDLIIAHFSLPTGFAASILCKKEQIPFIIIEHSSFLLKEKLSCKIKKMIYNESCLCKKFICVSDYLAKSISNKIKIKNIKVIPNMINDRFSYYPIEHNDRFVFFSAGMLRKIKNFDLLIDSFISTFKVDDNVILKIAGAGELYDELNNKIRINKRENQIFLIGQLSRDEMLDNYKKSNCFVLLSEKETFGIVYREALAVGRPIIATPNGGIQENWDDSYGFLLKSYDIKEIGNALKNMVDKYDYDFGKISKKCISIYSSDKILTMYDEIFNEIK